MRGAIDHALFAEINKRPRYAPESMRSGSERVQGSATSALRFHAFEVLTERAPVIFSSQGPVGYLNTLQRDEHGREVRGIAIDPDRAHLVTWAFQAYASGNYSLSALHKELTRGDCLNNSEDVLDGFGRG